MSDMMLHDADRILTIAKEAGLELAPGSLRLNEMGLDFQVAFGTDRDAVEWVCGCRAGRM